MSRETVTLYEHYASYPLYLPDMSATLSGRLRDIRSSKVDYCFFVRLVSPLLITCLSTGPSSVQPRLGQQSAEWRRLHRRELLSSSHTRRTAVVPSSTSMVACWAASTCWSEPPLAGVCRCCGAGQLLLNAIPSDHYTIRLEINMKSWL